ncbi:asparaginase [Paenibacillus eucommiae]|uniref:L-asparaginase II n=1 Tax=Paenibacillus eucommiae TaxID=1355755 RepID=A0ABS4J5L8_9BACL|nr:asparaginase [Paenibacillus eucommiae]MBP1994079.1 L-asparaginase II [Paenibacillus eucommiae]
MAEAEVLVEEYRGGSLENVHEGHICGVMPNGEVKYAVGNPLHRTFLRSSAKPIQAIPAIVHGVDERYLLDEPEVAMMAASHRAEPIHVAALESMMLKTGVREEQLVCHPTYPLSASARHELIARAGQERRIYHNCSGKHLGVLALCRKMGYSTEDYWHQEHPVQQEILRTMAMMADMRQDEITVGTDGCGFPVAAIPLQNLAAAYLKLACPDLIADPAVRTAVEKISGVMHRNNRMISGTGLICPELLADNNIVAKGGAKGVYCFGLREERLGFALKVMDGSEDEWPLIVASILEQIGYRRKETIDRLYTLYPVDIRNDNNKLVGRNETVFELKTV